MVGNPSRSWQLQTKTCISGFACSSYVVCFGSWGGGNHYYDSTAHTAMQQHVMEHGEHDKAQQKSWSSTASGLSSRCPDTVLPLDPARSGREGEVDCVPLPHYNPIHSACHLNQQHTFTASTLMQVKSSVVMGKQRSSR